MGFASGWLLMTGMIWDDKKNGEKDDWHTYRHEREAIFDFIAKNRISGCVLMSGDIHVSRALRYPMKERGRGAPDRQRAAMGALSLFRRVLLGISD